MRITDVERTAEIKLMQYKEFNNRSDRDDNGVWVDLTYYLEDHLSNASIVEYNEETGCYIVEDFAYTIAYLKLMFEDEDKNIFVDVYEL